MFTAQQTETLTEILLAESRQTVRNLLSAWDELFRVMGVEPDESDPTLRDTTQIRAQELAAGGNHPEVTEALAKLNACGEHGDKVSDLLNAVRA